VDKAVIEAEEAESPHPTPMRRSQLCADGQ